MTYSDKLKLAMAEIKEVLTRHDLAAYVVLYEGHCSEYLLRIDPSWSVARLEDGGIRFRSKLTEFGGDKQAQKHATELTVGMFKHFDDLLMQHLYTFQQILTMLSETLQIEHTNATHTPHREH